jgi:hypothetical protein
MVPALVQGDFVLAGGKTHQLLNARSADDYGNHRDHDGEIMCRLCRIYRRGMFRDGFRKGGYSAISECPYCKRMKEIIGERNLTKTVGEGKCLKVP